MACLKPGPRGYCSFFSTVDITSIDERASAALTAKKKPIIEGGGEERVDQTVTHPSRKKNTYPMFTFRKNEGVAIVYTGVGSFAVQ